MLYNRLDALAWTRAGNITGIKGPKKREGAEAPSLTLLAEYFVLCDYPRLFADFHRFACRIALGNVDAH